MAKFKNPHGLVIETNDPATINDYQQREGFTEVKEKSSSGSSSSSSAKDDSKK